MQETITKKVYKAIFNDIIAGVYSSGDILREKELLEKYNVSKSPVREALVQLCSEGVLVSRPRYGYEIVKMTKDDIRNILDYRLILETGALRGSIGRITKGQIDRLRDINKRCSSQEAKDDFWVHWDYNVQFHLELISFYGNEFAYDNLKSALTVLTRAYAQFYWDKWSSISFPRDMKHHVNIIKCLRKKDIDGAVHFLKEDFEDFEM